MRLLSAALSGIVLAQPTFRSAVDLVTIPVTVTPQDATRPVGELGVADFRLYEDGVLQPLALVSHEPQPLSVCVLVDSSPSMGAGRQPLASRAVDTLLAGLSPDDEASLHFFSGSVTTRFPWTSASRLPRLSWLEWRLSLGTAIIDALKTCFALVETATNPRRVILVVSDGGDNASGTPLAALVGTRRQSETRIYGIQTEWTPSRPGPRVNRGFANVLPEVIGDSGGTIHRVQSVEESETAARALLDELRSQYTLGYTPLRPLDGGYRTVKVETADASLVVRHGAGYRAVARAP